MAKKDLVKEYDEWKKKRDSREYNYDSGAGVSSDDLVGEYNSWKKNYEASQQRVKPTARLSQPSPLMQGALDMANPLSKNYVDPFAQKASYDWYSQPESMRSDILSRYAQQAAFDTKYDGMSYADRAAALEELKRQLKGMSNPEQGAEYQYLRNNLAADYYSPSASRSRSEDYSKKVFGAQRDRETLKRENDEYLASTDEYNSYLNELGKDYSSSPFFDYKRMLDDAEERGLTEKADEIRGYLDRYRRSVAGTREGELIDAIMNYSAPEATVNEIDVLADENRAEAYRRGALSKFDEHNLSLYSDGDKRSIYTLALEGAGIASTGNEAEDRKRFEETLGEGKNFPMYISEQDRRNVEETLFKEYAHSADNANANYKQVTSEEKALYYALIAKGKNSEAAAYINSLRNDLYQRAKSADAKRRSDKIKEEGAFWGTIDAIGQTALSVPGSVLGGIPSALDFAGQIVSTGEYDPYLNPEMHVMQNEATASRQAVSDTLRDVTGGGLAPFLYNAGMSAVDSAVGAIIGNSLGGMVSTITDSPVAKSLAENAYTFIMGSGAASSRAEELYLRGASNEQIIYGAITAGLIESLFEEFSLQNLMHPNKTWSVIRRILTQAGVEGSEELATDIANHIAGIGLDNNSDINTSIRELLANNPDMSYQDAQKEALKSAAGDTIESFLAGALSGGLSAGAYDASTGVQRNFINRSVGKNISSNYQAENTVKQGLEADENSEAYKLAKDIDERQKAGKKVSNKALGELARALDTELTEKSGNALEKASEYRREAAAAETVENALKENGATDEKAADLAPLVSKSILGEELTDAEQTKIGNNTAAVRYMDEVGSKTSEISGETGLQQLALRVNATTRGTGSTKASDRLREGALDKVFETAMRNELKPAKLSDNEIGKANETSYKVSTTGKTTYNGKAVDIDAIDEIGDGNALVTLDNGETAKLSEIEFADKGEAVAWQTITSIDGITPKAASELIAQYKNKPANVTAGVWARGIAEGYEIGRSGKLGTKEFPKAEAAAKYLSNIGNDARRISETVGRQNARFEQHKEAIEVDRKNVNNKNVNDAADTLDKMGRKYKIVEGIEGDGYIEKDGTIVLNKDAKDPIGFVLKHELTHYAETSKDYDGFVKAVKGSRAFAAWIDKQSLKDGTQLQQEADYLRRLKDRYRRHGVTLTNTEAHREMIANFVGDTLFNENGVGLDGLVNGMNAADRNAVMRFLTKIADFFRKHFTKKGETAYLEHFFSQLQNTATGERTEEKTYSISAQGTLSGDLQYHFAEAENHIGKLEAYNFKDSAMAKPELIDRVRHTVDMWGEISNELNSFFLNEWNEQDGKDRAFSIFKEQSGYKYNIEFSSMCKKGVPLFEAIDKIVTDEAVAGKLKGKRLDALKKEILYTILKDHGFDIPCAICYVEQARRREGDVIAAFLNGNESGKIGWNSTLGRIENEMRSAGVEYKFDTFDKSIATDKFTPSAQAMDVKTQNAFFSALVKIANEEIEKANSSSKTKRSTITEATPEAISKALKGSLPANLALIKVLAQNPDSRMRFSDLALYSSMTTHNLAKFYQPLYSLFNRQGGTAGYKTKQRPVPYMSDLMPIGWKSDSTRKAGGIRNQSNSDFQMYLFLDQAQMYADLTAKGYYLQAYTKTLSELKLFGLSKAKINASLIPLVHIYYNADGTVNLEKTRENAGLGTNGELLFDDVEGIPHEEALALLADKEYSKNCCGICIGYSDKHIAKMLDDSRIQMVIGFHDKTNDPVKRYKGAQYAVNYNGRNEAVNKKTGETVHLNFTDFLLRAENMVKSNGNTVHFNRKAYGWDDVPRLATALYLAECDNKGYYPAYSDYGKGMTDFSKHNNYYKLLADYGLYDSEGHYAPHSKVEYNLPKTVPVYENGRFSKMKTEDFIKKELQGEAATRDALAAALADKSEEGIIPQFAKALDDAENGREYSIPETFEDVKRSDEKYLAAVNSGDMETAQRMVDEAAKAAGYDSPKLYHGTNAFGFTVIDNNAPGADGYSFWASNKEDISGTYARYGKARQISSEISEEDIDIIIEEAEEKLDAAADKFRRAIDKNISEWVYGQTDNSYLRKLIREANPEMGSGDGVYDVLIDEVYNAFSDYLYDDLGEDYDVDEWLEDTPEGKEITEAILNAEGAASALAEVRDGEVIGGIYSLYAITDNMFELDAKGSEWNNIRPQGIEGLDKAETEGRPYRTRDIAAWAKEKGYDGVIFRNVKDNGAYGHKGRGDVYAFFKPKSQIKSADPVTYDDKGNVIPLSERFNEGNEDIRWSIPESADELSREWVEKGKKYGTFDPGEKNTTGILTPQQVDDKTRVERAVRTILGDGTLSDEYIYELGKETLLGRRSYEPESDQYAKDYIENATQQELEARVTKVLGNRNLQAGKLDVAAASYLIKQAIADGDTKKALEMEADLSAMLTHAGQFIQGWRLFKQMTPFGKLMSLQRAVRMANEEVRPGGRKATIDENLAMLLLEAKTEKEQQEAADNITADVAAQLDSSWLEKWNAWRYMSMLINPRTHARNIIGNAIFVPAVYLKDIIATGFEKIPMFRNALKADERHAVKVKKEYADFAKFFVKDANVERDLKGGWGSFNRGVALEKAVFKGKFESFRKSMMGLLEKEDMWFKNIHYKHAFASYLQAQRVDTKSLSTNLKQNDKRAQQLIMRAHEYAVSEAFKNTYNDANAFSKMMNDLGRKHAISRFLVDSVVPFRKTPANIVKRGVEYSPIGLLTSISKGAIDYARTEKIKKQYENGEISRAEYNKYMSTKGFDGNKFIEKLASGLTGTGIFLLGVLLRSMGVLHGRARDDKDKYLRQLGRQDYSAELFGGTFSIDWAAPMNLPLFMGVELMDLLADTKEGAPIGPSTFTKPMSQFLQPIINLSMLEGVQNAIESVSYSNEGEEVSDFAEAVAASYFTQAMPTFLGAVARIADEKKRAYYMTNHASVDKFVQKVWNDFRAKIPAGYAIGGAVAKPPAIDAWGREISAGGLAQRIAENLFSPGYWKKVNYTDVDKEVLRVYDATKDNSVIPKKPSKYIEISGEKKYLDEWEYCEYSVQKGTYSYGYIADALNSSKYKTLSDDQKAEVIKDLYSYANAKAKDKVSDYDISSINTYKSAYKYEQGGGSVADFYIDKEKSK